MMTSGRSDLIDIPVDLKAETIRAFCVDAGTSAGKVWVPKSMCEYDPAERVLTMQSWLAKEKGLI